ncbi:MAG: PH domain-containing protein [Candidatus Omnitrophota bacterium]
MESIMLIIAIFSIFLFVFALTRAIKPYANKNFNNLNNWEIRPIQNRRVGVIKNFFTQKLLSPDVVQFENDEQLAVYIDFSFYPPKTLSFEDWYFKVIYLTNKRIVFARFFLFSYSKLKFKSIPFSDIEGIKVNRIFKMSYIRISLKSGEIYQIALNFRLLSEERVCAYKKVLEILENMRNHI